MVFTSGTHNNSTHSLLYVCNVRVQPNGRFVTGTDKHLITYWHLRVKITIEFSSPDDYLEIFLEPEVKYQEMLRNQVEKCYGFWCGNKTQICLYGDMRCDQADGCFDGGSDEKDCPPNQFRDEPPAQAPPTNGAPWYLSWLGNLNSFPNACVRLAVMLVPLLIVFVGRLICMQRRQLDDIETGDEEDALKASQSPSPGASDHSPLNNQLPGLGGLDPGDRVRGPDPTSDQDQGSGAVSLSSSSPPPYDAPKPSVTFAPDHRKDSFSSQQPPSGLSQSLTLNAILRRI
ncbi:hypothetical protein Ciccas_003638 [Cichlidogyrus casuarinus]|uniref:Uncharacterized protein n=1 Tax=Cichlidogyrus casuarinus TaxID=1844966 RepID=A0ABD2QEQ1_9PLAT